MEMGARSRPAEMGISEVWSPSGYGGRSDETCRVIKNGAVKIDRRHGQLGFLGLGDRLCVHRRVRVRNLWAWASGGWCARHWERDGERLRLQGGVGLVEQWWGIEFWFEPPVGHPSEDQERDLGPKIDSRESSANKDQWNVCVWTRPHRASVWCQRTKDHKWNHWKHWHSRDAAYKTDLEQLE